MKPYLLLYNLGSAAGWAYVWYVAVTCLIAGKPPAEAWSEFGYALCIVQSAAALEIVHSMVKIVRSPVFTTFLQVFSRYGVLWFYTYNFTSSQQHWSLYLMVISWGTVEVPRYLFYALNLYMEHVPFPLFWLRYSLFMVLYPSGITGELLQIVACMSDLKAMSVVLWYLTILMILMYVPGGPTMFGHMMSQRKKTFKARSTPKVEAPVAGVEFPLDQSGKRSTTEVNQGAIAAAMDAVDPAAGAAARKEKNWRFGYAKHVVRCVELSCQSNEACLKIAKTGLDYLHSHFDFVDKEKGSMSIKDAMKNGKGSFETFTIVGNKKKDSNFQFHVPYQKFEHKQVNDLKGEELLAQLNKWADQGVIESDARDAIANMVKRPEFHGKSLSDKYFVLLGAGSAMGPLKVLLELGANIVALDLDRDFIWKRLIGLARDSPGTFTFPVKKKLAKDVSDDELFKNSGANLLTDTPKICNWICEQYPEKQLILGGYAYMDAAMFVKLAMAMDAIMAGVLEKRKNAALAFLCSPTDVFVTSDETHQARDAAFKKMPLWQSLLRAILPKRMLVKNAIAQAKGTGSETYSIVDGLAVAQGPNYALAKRLQHWRCMLAREAGHTVSTNIAPSTATESVVHNPQFAAAYMGMKFFSPMEVAYEALSNSVMTALLLNDVCNPDSAANPKVKIGNQIRLFAYTSAHFGIWRMAFKCGSIGEVSALIGYAKIYAAYLWIATALCVGFMAMVLQKGPPHTW